jgi:ADP-ribose pyrophosphatase YjhB (NUDIX family)
VEDPQPASLPRIRVIAIAVIRRGDLILVFEGRDESRDLTFYRPLGGGVEFGEATDAALRREFHEEIDADLTDLRLLGVLENRFTFEGEPGHEVVFVYEARLADPALRDQEAFEIRLDDGSVDLGLWRRLDGFDMRSTPLYPDGLLELLRSTR